MDSDRGKKSKFRHRHLSCWLPCTQIWWGESITIFLQQGKTSINLTPQKKEENVKLGIANYL